MTYNDIRDKVKTLKIPIFYSEDKENKTVPRILLYEDGKKLRGSDKRNYIAETSYTLELITKGKDFATEKQLDEILSFAELDKDWSYDNEENIMTTFYFFTLITKI